LLFRLGDFYELFNEDAQIASKELDIVLTARGEGVDKWPMCGVPYHAVDGYIARLIDAGHTVAIADQVEDASKTKGLVKREVVRVITPGTILEVSMLSDASNNFLMALVEHGEEVGLAVVDVSTGEFLTTQLPGKLGDERALNEIGRLNPAEIILPEELYRRKDIQSLLNESGAKLTPRNDLEFSAQRAKKRLLTHFGVSTLDGYGLSEKKVAMASAGAIIGYLHDVHKTNTVTVSSVRTYSTEEYMVVDSTTQRNLELVKNARDGSTRGTLFSVLSKTVTSMGKRLLKKWMLQPLGDVTKINERLDAVDDLARNALTRKDIASSLRNLCDLERVSSRIVFGTGGARELVTLRETLLKLPEVKKAAKTCSSKLMKNAGKSIDLLKELANDLQNAVVDSPPLGVKDGGMIREGYDETLDQMKASISQDKKWIASLQSQERSRTGIKSLRVGYNKVFGYYIEVTKANLSLVPDEYERKQTLTNAERFITPELKEKEQLVLAGEEKINEREFEIFESLRQKVSVSVDTLRQNSNALAVLDVIVSLAEVAVTRRYTRPTITKDTKIAISDGRHPSMEVILGPNEFVPNSLEIGDGGTSMLIVTGPNMAGKSTYMRQAALIVLLAQMGSFVPARQAEIGLVDRIFTRVGAFDDLTARQSTFMVEMVETANILNNATERSLVILDEIGRGTSTYDGMALAWAVAERLVQMKTRTLFATHFHQMTEMAEVFHGVKNVHTLAKESGDTIVFLHKVVDGGTDRSYGVHVAALAGIPDEVIMRARDLLIRLEQEHVVDLDSAPTSIDATEQTSLEILTVDDPVVERIKHMDLERTTPFDALTDLKEMQDEIKKRRRS
jgi:DNA mismatch repair protein MutS